MTEQIRVVLPDAALHVVQVGMTDPARLDLHHGLPGPGIGTVIVTSSTGASLAREMTAWTCCGTTNSFLSGEDLDPARPRGGNVQG